MKGWIWELQAKRECRERESLVHLNESLNSSLWSLYQMFQLAGNMKLWLGLWRKELQIVCKPHLALRNTNSIDSVLIIVCPAPFIVNWQLILPPLCASTIPIAIPIGIPIDFFFMFTLVANQQQKECLYLLVSSPPYPFRWLQSSKQHNFFLKESYISSTITINTYPSSMIKKLMIPWALLPIS